MGIAKWQNGGLGLCSTPMNNFLLNISFKGKETPAQRQIFLVATSGCDNQRGVTYFLDISAKTKLFAKPFQPDNQMGSIHVIEKPINS